MSTRNAFALHGSRLYVAKVGDIKVRWSRELPSEPSSVTVIQEADGRHYASFVVEVAVTPLPVIAHDIGLDLGLKAPAATSDGEFIAYPRYVRKAERRLARAQRSLCRKQKGSANRARARVRVAVQHREGPRGAGRPPAQDSASPGPRQPSVYVEDLAVSGLAACGHRDGPKPLSVREWACPACGTVHDRDVTAATNIRFEGRKVALR